MAKLNYSYKVRTNKFEQENHRNSKNNKRTYKRSEFCLIDIFFYKQSSRIKRHFTRNEIGAT